MRNPSFGDTHESAERKEQPAKVSEQYCREKQPHRRLGRRDIRQAMYQLKLGGRMLMLSARPVRV